MRFRIRPNKAFTAEVRAVAEQQLQLAASHLENRPDGLHKAIHDARRCFKRTRALYRLVSSDMREFQAAENARIRDIAKSLSSVRDATSMIEACDYLRGYTRNPHDDAALTRVIRLLTHRRDHIAADKTALELKASAAIAGCAAAQQAVARLSFRTSGRQAARLLAQGWQQTVRRARQAIKACEGDDDDEAMHTLRKRSQDYWMYLQLLRDVWPSAMLAKQAEVKRLIDLLGHSNDLSLLAAVVHEEPKRFDNSEDKTLLLDAINHRQKALRNEALEHAKEVFSEGARRESRIVRQLWLEAGK